MQKRQGDEVTGDFVTWKRSKKVYFYLFYSTTLSQPRTAITKAVKYTGKDAKNHSRIMQLFIIHLIRQVRHKKSSKSAATRHRRTGTDIFQHFFVYIFFYSNIFLTVTLA